MVKKFYLFIILIFGLLNIKLNYTCNNDQINSINRLFDIIKFEFKQDRIIKILIKSCQDYNSISVINSVDKDTKSLFFWAIKRRLSKVIDFIINSFFLNIHYSDSKGRNALFYIIRYSDNLDLIDNFISRGLNINALNNKGLNCIMYALKYNKRSIVNFLINRYNNLDIYISDYQYRNLLIYSAIYDHFDLAKFLINRYKSDGLLFNIHKVDIYNRNALIYAAMFNSKDIFHILAENSLSVNIKDCFGYNVLSYIIMYNHLNLYDIFYRYYSYRR
jgi:ankyrin repeat protein